jgi:hypothetical protein
VIRVSTCLDVVDCYRDRREDVCMLDYSCTGIGYRQGWTRMMGMDGRVD